jgi:hypothetical protein
MLKPSLSPFDLKDDTCSWRALQVLTQSGHRSKPIVPSALDQLVRCKSLLKSLEAESFLLEQRDAGVDGGAVVEVTLSGFDFV